MQVWLGGDIPRALEIARAIPAHDPTYFAAQAILAGVDFDNGQCALDHARDLHARALASPPADPDLHISLMRNMAFFEISVNRLPDARRVLRELDALMPVAHPRLRLAAAYTRFRLARAEDNYPDQLAAVAEGFQLVDGDKIIPPERVGLARLTLFAERLEAALSNHDIGVAARDLVAVSEYSSHSLFPGWESTVLHEVLFCELTGQYEQGLARIRAMSPEHRRPNAKHADVAEATLLIRLERFPEADQIMARLDEEARAHPGVSEGPGEVAEADLAALRGLRALASRDMDTVWGAAETMARVSERDHPTWSTRGRELLIEAQLTGGRPQLARRLLEREDLEAAKRRYRIHWARLHWIEGNHAGAVDCFRSVLAEMLPQYPGYVSYMLQYALELSAYDVARLWSQAIEGLSVRVGDAGQAALPDGGTLGRRHRLRCLFEQHPRLTRAQVAALLPCSLNTATRDLAALVEEGFVERVNTSAHLRTSYFVRVTSPPN